MMNGEMQHPKRGTMAVGPDMVFIASIRACIIQAVFIQNKIYYKLATE